MSFGRRDLLLGATTMAVAGRSPSLVAAPGKPEGKTRPGPICFFSKFVFRAQPRMTPREMARALKSLGYAGIDLSVRSKDGHVLPDNVARDLPPALAAIREEGLTVPLITTALVSASDPTAGPILSTAGRAQVPLFKPGYWKYAYQDIRRELRKAGQAIKGLAALGKRSNIALGLHNHGGDLGAAMWDAATFMDGLDPRWAGYYLDTRHVFAEGGVGAWKAATHLVGPRLKAISVKDFHWEKTDQGWGIKKVPLGQGMVDLGGFLGVLAQHKFAGPISLHVEYPIEGGRDAVLKAAERDLGYLRKKLGEVYGAV